MEDDVCLIIDDGVLSLLWNGVKECSSSNLLSVSIISDLNLMNEFS